MNCTINFTWDPEAQVWIASSDDIKGLVLESGSFDALLERVRYAVPELIGLNGLPDNRDIDLTFISKRRERIAL